MLPIVDWILIWLYATWSVKILLKKEKKTFPYLFYGKIIFLGFITFFILVFLFLFFFFVRFILFDHHLILKYYSPNAHCARSSKNLNEQYSTRHTGRIGWLTTFFFRFFLFSSVPFLLLSNGRLFGMWISEIVMLLAVIFSFVFYDCFMILFSFLHYR